jgi:hypothetical protein
MVAYRPRTGKSVAQGRKCCERQRVSSPSRDRGRSSAKLDGDKTEKGEESVLSNLPKSIHLSHYKTSTGPITSWKRRVACNLELGSILRTTVFSGINAAHRVPQCSYNLPRLSLAIPSRRRRRFLMDLGLVTPAIHPRLLGHLVTVKTVQDCIRSAGHCKAELIRRQHPTSPLLTLQTGWWA